MQTRPVFPLIMLVFLLLSACAQPTKLTPTTINRLPTIIFPLAHSSATTPDRDRMIVKAITDGDQKQPVNR